VVSYGAEPAGIRNGSNDIWNESPLDVASSEFFDKETKKYVFKKSLRQGIKDAVLNGIVDAIVQSAVIQMALKPVFDAITKNAELLSTPDIARRSGSRF
jgi:hypothetical protein